MSQLTFAEAEYEGKKRKTRREKFLERMDEFIPWEKLERQLAKKYSKGKVGRKPYASGTLLILTTCLVWMMRSDYRQVNIKKRKYKH